MMVKGKGDEKGRTEEDEQEREREGHFSCVLEKGS